MYYIGIAFILCACLICTRAQTGTCDYVNRMCVNGMCELQFNQQLACTCNPNFLPDPSNPLLCNPIPSCNLVSGNPGLQCLNGQCQPQATGAFTCVCFPGYQPNINNPNICDDIDECQTSSIVCVGGGCVNIPGDYFCTACVQGYSLDLNSKCQRTTVTPSGNPNVHPWLWMWLLDGLS